jgi:hypothetical protein
LAETRQHTAVAIAAAVEEMTRILAVATRILDRVRELEASQSQPGNAA